MDELLAASVLEDIEARHWARYKMTWPPGIAPADTQVFRIAREIEKCTLSDRDVLKVRTQAQARQQCAVRERTKVGEGIGIIIHPKANVEEAMPTLHNYLSTLTTLLVA